MFTLEYIKEVSDNVGYFLPFVDVSAEMQCLIDPSLTEETYKELALKESPGEIPWNWSVITAQRNIFIQNIILYETRKEQKNAESRTSVDTDTSEN